MNDRRPKTSVSVAAALLLTTLAAALVPANLSIAQAHSFELGSIKIIHPWSRETPPGARVAGGFLKITNSGKEPDRLIGGTFVAAKRIEIHEMTMDGGVMRMRELAKGLEIKPGETVELKPGSFHVMFMDMQAPIKAGGMLKGTLVFEKAGTIEVSYKIEPMGARSSTDHGSHGNMKH